MLTPPVQEERLGGSRRFIPFPVILRGKDATGDRFELHSTLDDISGCSLALWVARPLAPGSKVFGWVRFSMAPVHRRRGAVVALLGTVQRVDPVGQDYWHVVITFDRHRFVYEPSAGSSRR